MNIVNETFSVKYIPATLSNICVIPIGIITLFALDYMVPINDNSSRWSSIIHIVIVLIVIVLYNRISRLFLRRDMEVCFVSNDVMELRFKRKKIQVRIGDITEVTLARRSRIGSSHIQMLLKWTTMGKKHRVYIASDQIDDNIRNDNHTLGDIFKIIETRSNKLEADDEINDDDFWRIKLKQHHDSE